MNRPHFQIQLIQRYEIKQTIYIDYTNSSCLHTCLIRSCLMVQYL
jgi:hypothetical protein